MDPQPDRQFPWSELVLLVVVGVPALAVALMCMLFVWTYSGPQFDTVIINDHTIGGAVERVIALALGTMSGSLGVFSVLRFYRRIRST